MDNKQQQWAAALKRAKQQMARQKNVPLKLQKKHLQEDMEYFKTQLITAAKEKKEKESEKHFIKLIELRAKQLIILIQELEKTFGVLEDGIVRYHTKKYHQDCIGIAIMADRLLE